MAQFVEIAQGSIVAAPAWSGEVRPIADNKDLGAPGKQQVDKALFDLTEAQKAVNKEPKNKEFRNALAIAHRNANALRERAVAAEEEILGKDSKEVADLWLQGGDEGEITKRAYTQYMLANELAEQALADNKMFIALPPETVSAPKSSVDFQYTYDRHGNTVARNLFYGDPMFGHGQVSDLASALKQLRADNRIVSGYIQQFGASKGALFSGNKAISTGTDSGDIVGQIFHPMAWETFRHLGPWQDGRYAYQLPTPFTDTINLFDYVAFPTVGYHTENAAVSGSDFTTDKVDIAAYEMYETTTISDKVQRSFWQGSNLLSVARARLENAIFHKMNVDFTTGDGNAKPMGITSQITAGNPNNKIVLPKGTANDVGFNPADLSTAMWELQSAYRRLDGTTITFGSKTMPRVLNAKSSDYYLRQMIEQADRLIRVDVQAGGTIVAGRQTDDMMVVAGRLDGWILAENEHLGNAYTTASTVIGYAGMTRETAVVRNGPFFVHRQTPSTGNIATNNDTVGVGYYTDMVVALHGAVTAGDTGKGPIVNIETGT